MRNLKKVLAFTVAMVMCFGLMTTGFAAGTDYTTYSDVKEIKYVDAVALLSALDILRGTPEGKFNPLGDVTRGELAKMLYVVLNNGYDDGATIYKSVPTKLTDVSGHWAEGYIKYCYTEDIIAGVGDNTFRPDDKVTGLQAQKMILVALGYDPIKEAFVGTNWATKVAVCAQRAELNDKVEDVDMQVAISRQVSAQILRNGLFAVEVSYPNGVRQDRLGDDSFTPLTFAWDRLGLKILEGVVVANDQVSIEDQGICDTNKTTFKYDYSFYDNTYNSGSRAGTEYVTIDVDTPYTMVGKTVYAYVKVKAGTRLTSYNWVTGIERVFGNVVEVPGKNIVTYTYNNDYIKEYKSNIVEATTSSIDHRTQFYVNYWSSHEGVPYFRYSYKDFDNYYKLKDRSDASGVNSKGQRVIMISNDGNKNVEYVFGFDKRFGEITGYSNEKLAIEINDSANYKNFEDADFEDVINVDQFALNDKALMWKIPENDTYMLEKPDTVKGTMTGSTGTTSDPKAIINGTQYTISRDHIGFDDIIVTDFVGKELTYYLDGTRICGIDAKSVSRASDNYCVIRDSKAEGTYGNVLVGPKFTAAILTSEGNEKTLEIDRIYTADGNNRLLLTDVDKTLEATSTSIDPTTNATYGDGANNNVYVANTSVKDSTPISINYKVFKYTINSDNELVLYMPNLYDKQYKNYEKNDASLSVMNNDNVITSKAVNNQTVAFVQNDNGKWYVYTGQNSIPTFKYNANTMSAVLGKFSKTDDLLKAFAVFNASVTATSSTDKIALILRTVAEPDSTASWVYSEIELFDGEQIITYKGRISVRGDDAALDRGYKVNIANGRLVKYSVVGGKVDSMDLIDLTDSPADNGGFYVGYVLKGQDSSNMFTIESYKNSNEVHTFYVDSSTKIFKYAGTAEADWTFPGKVTSQASTDALYTAAGDIQYRVVVREADNKGVAKTVYLFAEKDPMSYPATGTSLG